MLCAMHVDDLLLMRKDRGTYGKAVTEVRKAAPARSQEGASPRRLGASIASRGGLGYEVEQSALAKEAAEPLRAARSPSGPAPLLPAGCRNAAGEREPLPGGMRHERRSGAGKIAFSAGLCSHQQRRAGELRRAKQSAERRAAA